MAQSAVLPLVDLIVHHGGTGTVLSALEVGLPQLLLPQGADQFFNAEILTAAGAARALPNDAQQPGAIGEAVQALLGDSPERQAAARLRDEIAAMPSPSDVVPALVELAGALKRAPTKRSGLRILHPEPDLECHLEVLDLAIDEMPADVGDLEPVKASKRACRALHSDADGVVDPLVDVPTISDNPYTWPFMASLLRHQFVRP